MSSYIWVQGEVRGAVIKTKNEEWVKLGESLCNDFGQNQSRFWARYKNE